MAEQAIISEHVPSFCASVTAALCEIYRLWEVESGMKVEVTAAVQLLDLLRSMLALVIQHVKDIHMEALNDILHVSADHTLHYYVKKHGQLPSSVDQATCCSKEGKNGLQKPDPP